MNPPPTDRLITCMGEILMDMLPIEEDGATVGFRMHPGGAPFNVAVGLARLGHTVAFATRLADDFFGRALGRYLEQQGVRPDFVQADPGGRSTLAFVAREAGENVYTFYNTDTADTRIQLDDVPAALFSTTRLFHCVGSVSLLGGSTPAAVVATAERLQGTALVSFDPNVRPNMVTDEAHYRELVAHLLALADLVKVSEADLGWLLPGVALEQAAADLLAQGPALVIITRGGEGVLAQQAGGAAAFSLPAFPVTVVDTVGAGDAFSAGLLAALAERGITRRAHLEALAADELHASLRTAAAVSALTCSRAGADPPTAAELAHFLAQRAEAG